MNRALYAFTCLCFGIALAGCRPSTPTDDPARAAPRATGAPAPAPVVEPAVADQAPALDLKGFAGVFANATASLTLGPDGSAEVRDGSESLDGTWSSEDGGAHVRFDPNSKTEPDRLYAVAGADEIRLLQADATAEAGDPLLRITPAQ